MLCKHQKRIDEPCPGGLSHKIKCLLGHGIECMNKCNATCADFVSAVDVQRSEMPRQQQYVPKQYNPHMNTADTRYEGGCGGCGENRSV